MRGWALVLVLYMELSALLLGAYLGGPYIFEPLGWPLNEGTVGLIVLVFGVWFSQIYFFYIRKNSSERY